MNMFDGLRTYPEIWVVQNVRPLAEEEKQLVSCAIVVKSEFGRSLEFFTKKGSVSIPISIGVNANIGFIPDIDKIEIITLKRKHDKAIIHRVSF